MKIDKWFSSIFYVLEWAEFTDDLPDNELIRVLIVPDSFKDSSSSKDVDGVDDEYPIFNTENSMKNRSQTMTNQLREPETPLKRKFVVIIQ
jgi:hypothetical protein